MALILVVCALLFHSLNVTVSTEWIIIRFGVGLIRKRFAVSAIEDVHIVQNHWYYGWGIKYTPHGWLFNVSGFDAVEIWLEHGRKYRIGTDEPKQLHAWFVRSTHAHATVNGIDTASAAGVEGVVAVFTASDLIHAPVGMLQGTSALAGKTGEPIFREPRVWDRSMNFLPGSEVVNRGGTSRPTNSDAGSPSVTGSMAM